MPYYTHHKIRALTNVYAFTFYQNTLLTECFITYFTAIWALTTVYAFMFHQNTMLTECLCGRTHIATFQFTATHHST